MPELPEVETTRRGIVPYLIGRTVRQIKIHNRQLRWPIPASLNKKLAGQPITSVTRRGKYLLVHTAAGTLLIHLGMSGSLRVLENDEPRRKHDHVELFLDDGHCLRYCDPRRFGAWLWTSDDPLQHELLVKLDLSRWIKPFLPSICCRA